MLPMYKLSPDFLENNEIKWVVEDEDEKFRIKEFYSTDINLLLYVKNTYKIYKLISIQPLIWELFGKIIVNKPTYFCKEIIDNENITEIESKIECIDTYISFKNENNYLLTLSYKPDKRVIFLDSEIKISKLDDNNENLISELSDHIDKSENNKIEINKDLSEDDNIKVECYPSERPKLIKIKRKK